MSEQSWAEQPEAIAVIGMAGRFPGARDVDAFWRNLQDGVESIAFLSEEELLASGIEPSLLRDPKYVRACAALEDIERFDAAFFGISPREAELMDPQHRIFLECVWEAIQSAGYDAASYDAPIGVFAGTSGSSYQASNLFDHPATKGWPGWFHTLIGNDKDYLATHASYKLNLKGPSISVQTACSSSLVAVHMACMSLLDRECDMALAGGVTVRVPHRTGYLFAEGSIVSADGHCRAFDARATGTIFGSGAGVVVLKRLSDAIAAGDPVRAIVRGSAVNNDGADKVGFTAPSEAGQAQVITEALGLAGVEARTVQYVETHGTGTQLGDAIEIAALNRAFGAGGAARQSCAIGSVKTNVGHLESAAGITGFIKTVLALEHGKVPPSLHFESANASLDLAKSPFYVNTRLKDWNAGSLPRRAGVSSFGIGGTNAHVVLEQAPAEARRRASARERSPELLVLSATCAEALRALAARHAQHGTDHPELSLSDLCYTASVRRGHHEHRLAVTARSRQELGELLAAYAAGEARPGLLQEGRASEPAPGVVFVFGGQGSQWAGMGRELLAQEAVFREVIEACEPWVQKHAGFSLKEALSAPEGASRLAETQVAQPALFAMQVGLWALWRAWGIEPAAVIGHSVGEVAAAHVAGALGLEEAVRLVCLRGRVMQAATGLGKMAAVAVSADEALRALGEQAESVALAAVNAPRSVVLSGEEGALTEVLRRLREGGAHVQMLRVDYAFHSPQMAPLQRELARLLGSVKAARATVPMYSTVTGQRARGDEIDAAYWARNVKEPVLLARAVGAAIDDGMRVFLEVGPHPVLFGHLQECLSDRRQEGRVHGSLRRDREARQSLLETLGGLYAAGAKVSWERLYPERGRCVPLPGYPWQRERFWIEGPRARASVDPTRSSRARSPEDLPVHPLLGARFTVATQPGAHYWEQPLATESVAYLADHRVQGEVVLPGAAYVEMALAAAAQVLGPGAHRLEGIAFERMLALPPDSARVVQVAFVEEGPSRGAFQVSSREGDTWSRHAVGTLLRAGEETSDAPAMGEPRGDIQERCSTVRRGAEHYAFMEARGLAYGPSFRGVEQLWIGREEALGRVRLPDAAASQGAEHEIHPALLDACFHVLGALFPEERAEAGGTYVPIGLERVLRRRALPREVWAHGRLRPRDAAGPDADTIIGDLLLLDDDSRVIVEVRGLALKRLSSGAQAAPDPHEGLLYALDWRRQEHLADASGSASPAPVGAGAWLLFADRAGTGAALASQWNGRGEACVRAVWGPRYERIEPGLYQVDPGDPEAFRALIRDAFGAGRPCAGVVHMWSLDATPPAESTPETLEADQRLGSLSALHVAQALLAVGWRDLPRLWLVTRGAVEAGTDSAEIAVSQAPLWGLFRTLSQEHPELSCVRVDLSPARPADDAQVLARELGATDGEDQIALRQDGRYVARLARSELTAAEAEIDAPLEPAGDRPFRLEMRRPGVLSRLSLCAIERRPPGPGEVEIQVEAAGLNFLDVLLALGALPDDGPGARASGPRLGSECAGRVVAVGDGVTDLAVGDEVLALATESFSSFVVTSRLLVTPKPSSLSFTEAATLPIVFLTAYYALAHVGRLAAGERVLIHAGAGGVGMAAIQWAQHAGAEVFATAGSEDKRALLRSLGVQHVMDSRSLRFVDDVMRATNGEGIDVVLNSLSGEFIPASLGLLRDHGRFLEIGKRDYYENQKLGLRPFLKNLSFSLVDLRGMIAQRPAVVSRLLGEVVQHFAAGALRPLPCRSFPASQAAEAFGCMAQAKHVGKIALAMRDPAASLARSASSFAPASETGAPPGLLAPHGTYLITGGLGGLGLSLAGWMVSQGARHLTLVGRSGATEAAQASIRALEEAGAQVSVVGADVSRRDEVASILQQIEQRQPPLRGIVHAAAVLDDRMAIELNAERFRKVMGPKMLGAWNLHALTADKPLDFFVMYSSVASLLGSPGQGNYAAANAFLDALAHLRRRSGRRGTSVSWGPFSEVGMAAAHEHRGGRLASRGLLSLTPAQGAEVLGRLLSQGRAHVGVFRLDLRQWLEFYPNVAAAPLWSELRKESTQGLTTSKEARSLRAALDDALPGQRAALVERHIIEEIGRVLRQDPSRIDRSTPFVRLGLESLTTLELRNKLEASLGLRLSPVLLFTHATAAKLSEYVSGELGFTAKKEEPAPRQDAPAPRGITESVEQLSEEELLALFDEPETPDEPTPER